jgi:hypothetical protein
MSRRQLAWGAGVAVVLASVSGAVINELHQGWPWWVAAAAVAVTGAILAGWLTSGSVDSGPRVGRGAVVAGRDLGGKVRTDGSTPDSSTEVSPPGIGPGAVVAGQDITSTADIDTTGGPAARS